MRPAITLSHTQGCCFPEYIFHLYYASLVIVKWMFRKRPPLSVLGLNCMNDRSKVPTREKLAFLKKVYSCLWKGYPETLRASFYRGCIVSRAWLKPEIRKKQSKLCRRRVQLLCIEVPIGPRQVCLPIFKSTFVTHQAVEYSPPHNEFPVACHSLPPPQQNVSCLR